MTPPNSNTEVEIIAPDWRLNLTSKVVTIGSCFADVLGSGLARRKLQVLNNPLGTLFNPLTISKLLAYAVDDQSINKALFVQNSDGIWFHHDFHSSFASWHKSDLENTIVQKLEEVGAFIKAADTLVITLGTAFGYRHKASNQVVGNCHKAPSDKFVKELLNIEQIILSLEQLVFKLLRLNRELKIVLTLSPVRHTRDTLVLNQVSKSTLRLVCHKLTEKFKHVSYFPAYEVMLDQLRDYRYYKEDMIHPNGVAEAYIFQLFARAYLTDEALKFMKEWDSVLQMFDHRPMFENSPSHLRMLQGLKERLVGLSNMANIEPELKEVERRINGFSALK